MPYDLRPLVLTFQLASVTTVILIFLGIPLAYWLAFTKRKWKYIVETIVTMPLVLPPTVLGFYLLVLFSPQHGFGHFLETTFGIRVVFSFAGLVIGSVIFSLPFTVNPVKSAFQSVPASLIEASYTLGKSKLETLFRILIPNIKPSILTATVMSFAHTIGEFGVVLMIGGSIPGKTEVASIAIYTQVESLNYPLANMYSLILIALSFGLLLIFYITNRKTLKMY